MRTILCFLALAVSGISLLSGGVQAGEERIPLDKLPRAVVEAVKKRFPKAELVAAAKAQPDKIDMALPSNSARIVFELLKDRTGAPLFGVPYKGSATAMTEVIGGQVQTIIDTVTATRGHVTAGKLKPLAITTLKSSELLPGVKSVAEQGVPGFEMTAWNAFYAPAGTPKPIIDKLNAAVNAAIKRPDIVKLWTVQGAVPMSMTPEAFDKYLRGDIVKWAEVVKKFGDKPQ